MMNDYQQWMDIENPEEREISIASTETKLKATRGQIDTLRVSLENQSLQSLSSMIKHNIKNLVKIEHELKGDLSDLMQNRNLEVLNFALDGYAFENHSAPIDTLAVFLSTMQMLVYRVGNFVNSRCDKQSVPANVRNNLGISLAGVYDSSFGMNLVIPSQVDQLGSSTVIQTLDAMFSAFNDENTVDVISNLGKHATIAYKRFIRTLADKNIEPKFKWRCPNGNELCWNASLNTVAKINNRLSSITFSEEEIIETTGQLLGASMISGSFQFVPDDMTKYGNSVRGKVDADLFEDIAENFGHHCLAKYRVVKIYDETLERETKVVTLLKIKAI
jgi:hypothetical protein